MSCKTVVLFKSLIILFSGIAALSIAAESRGTAEPPAVVAIFPFAMHTPANLSYLQSGIRDMLSSRISWQGKVQVIDKSDTDKAVKGAKEISQNEALRVGASLKADYVLFGSITSTGQSVSIDAKMAAVSGKTEPVSFYAQTKTLDDVMPQVNLFAQQISQKVFGKQEEKPQEASAEAEALATRNPELLLPGAMPSGDKISYVNPNFVEVTPEGSLRQPGFWRSQDFQGGILGMDLGDVDGDGKSEIVAMQMRKLVVYKKENEGLRQIASFDGTTVDRFVWVSVLDLYREGKAYIFLTNLRTKNAVQHQSSENSRDVPGQSEDVSSYVLSVSGNKIDVIADSVPYFLNAVYMGHRGKVLIGQRQGDKYASAFTGGIYEMQLRGNSLVPGPGVNVPSEVNVFNFVKAELNNDKSEKTLVIDEATHKLRILSADGSQIWKSTAIFGATTNSFEGKVEDRRWNMVDTVSIPSPILIADLRKNGIPEIVINRNTTSFDQWLPNSMKYFDQGEIVSLSWDNMGLVENWKTRELNGQITVLRLGDLNGNGKQQLVISMVYAKDLLKLYDAKSVIFTYDLNVKEGSAKPPGDEKETVPLKTDKPSATKTSSSN